MGLFDIFKKKKTEAEIGWRVGGIGLHDAYRWRSTYGPDANHSVNGSHGCVNMPLDAARTTYENVEQGDMVLVHK